MIYRSRLLVATIIQCQSPRTTNISSSYKHGALNNTNGFRYLLYSLGPKVEEPLRSLLNCCCLVLRSLAIASSCTITTSPVPGTRQAAGDRQWKAPHLQDLIFDLRNFTPRQRTTTNTDCAPSRTSFVVDDRLTPTGITTERTSKVIP